MNLIMPLTQRQF